jgi:hypothetical protein
MMLFEIIVYIAIFGVVINAAAMLFVATLRVHAHATAGVAQRYVLDEFQRDFSEAATGGMPSGLDDEATPGELLVRLPAHKDQPQTARYALWRLDDQQRPTLQIVAEEGGVQQVEFFKTYNLRVDDLEAGQRDGLVSLGLLFKPKRAGAAGRRVDFVAALRAGGGA